MENHAETLQPIGWIFMLISVGFVTILVIWCFARVLSLPPEPPEEAD